MTSLDRHADILELAKCGMPPRRQGEPLFREAWHARIFAVMVALVQSRQFEWKAFQARLAAELREHQSIEANLSAEEIDLQYFDCWLHAAESLLADRGYLDDAVIARQIEAIRSAVREIRDSQLGHRH